MAQMKFYSGKVRLGGSPLNEVEIRGLPAPEIIMLQHMHGSDGIVNLRVAAKKDQIEVPRRDLEEIGASTKEGFSDRVTRAYLRRKYGATSDGKDKVHQVFGSDLIPLPKELAVDAKEVEAEETNRDLRNQIEREIRAKIDKEQAEAKAAEDAVEQMVA